MYNGATHRFESEEHNTNRYLCILEDAMKQAKLASCSPKYSIKLDVDFIRKDELIIVHTFGLPNWNALSLSYFGADDRMHIDDDFPFCSLSKEGQEGFFKMAFISVATTAIKEGHPLVYEDIEITSGMKAEEIVDDLLMDIPFDSVRPSEPANEEMLTNDPSMTV